MVLKNMQKTAMGLALSVTPPTTMVYQLPAQLIYQSVPRNPNPMVHINPLNKRQGKTVTLADRVQDLQNTAVWKKTIRQWGETAKLFDQLRISQVAMVPLGDILIDEDIQRPLDEKWASLIARPAQFDPAHLQVLRCIKRSDGKFISTDGQHTAAVLAALIDSGLLVGVTNWRLFEFPVQYILTDDLAFARRSFSLLNGKGKKKQSAYQMLRNTVYIVRIDGNTSDPEEVAAEQRVAIAESNQCFPVEENSTLSQYPGTFTNIATFESMNNAEIQLATAWHNQYFHRDPVHVSLFFMFKDFCREFEAAKIPFTQQLQEQLAGLIQNLFVDLSQFSSSVKEAHRIWHMKRYGYKGVWNDDAYGCGLMHLYKRFGGQEKLPPTLLDRFDDLIAFFDKDLLELAP